MNISIFNVKAIRVTTDEVLPDNHWIKIYINEGDEITIFCGSPANRANILKMLRAEQCPQT